MSAITEFVYKLPGTAVGNRPGAHRSKSRGSGMSFAAHARLFDQPDPRRLDLRASLQDIRGDWLVRTHLQRSSITVKVIVDVSQSMRYGSPGKLQVASDFIEALGNSANSYGDSVSLLAFDTVFRDDLFLPARMGRANGINMANTVRDSRTTVGEKAHNETGNNNGLAQTVGRIAGTTGLVFIVSDFHSPLEALGPVFDNLAAAMVVPVVVWDRTEVTPPAAGNWLPVRDIRSGSRKHVWLTAKTREQWLENVRQRRNDIHRICEEYDCAPFFIEEQFDAESLSRYFMENVA